MSALSYGFLIAESLAALAVVAILISLATAWAAWEWRGGNRDLAREAEAQRRKRQALGVPEWNGGVEER